MDYYIHTLEAEVLLRQTWQLGEHVPPSSSRQRSFAQQKMLCLFTLAFFLTSCWSVVALTKGAGSFSSRYVVDMGKKTSAAARLTLPCLELQSLEMYTLLSALPLLVILASFFSSTGAASASKSAIAGIKVNLRLSKLVPGFIDPFEPKGVLSIAFGKQTTLGNGATIGRRLSESCMCCLHLNDTRRLLKHVLRSIL